MHSADFKWRAVTLHYAYAAPCEVVGRVLGVPGRAVRRGMHSLRRPGTCWPKREMVALCTQLSSWRCCFVSGRPPLLLRGRPACRGQEAVS
ncbi:hypothetical protein JG687_00016398 [Phytophthora cactorum]|uniref:Uncharacterized protein n=1 Tax=Phytophthora cactorum TaxID=29920 RepID=A0A8T1TQS6_9STRA|nr:hypothetical protein JG687_00016398 [Phytophthora cactorum]